MCLFHLQFEKIILLGIEFCVGSFFSFVKFEDTIPLSSDFHCSSC